MPENIPAKTARFSEVVARSGTPEIHLTWTKPASDRVLQTALKQSRVLTVHQQAGGAKKDFGVVGLEPAPGTQFLIFPRSLRRFAGRRVVGINYELLGETLSLGTKPAATTNLKGKGEGRPHRQPKKTARAEKPVPSKRKTKTEPAPIPFEPEVEEADPVKAEIRRALTELSAGRIAPAQRRLKNLLSE
jgi:hypothetical protein